MSEATINPTKQRVRMIARRRPLSSDRLEASFEAGKTVAEMLNECGMDADVVAARVCIDDRVIESAVWEHVRPQAGQLVTVRVVPQGSGGQTKDVLRIVAMVGVVAAALLAPYAAGALGYAALGVGTLGGSLLTAGIGIAGSLAMNGPIPQPLPRRSMPLPDEQRKVAA